MDLNIYCIFITHQNSIVYFRPLKNKQTFINHFSAIMRQYACFTSIIDWLETVWPHFKSDFDLIVLLDYFGNKWSKKTSNCAKSTRSFYLGVPPKTLMFLLAIVRTFNRVINHFEGGLLSICTKTQKNMKITTNKIWDIPTYKTFYTFTSLSLNILQY